MQGGCTIAVTRGDVERPLTALAEGSRATWFLPQATPAAARKQWIAGMKPVGAVIVDAGAVAALSDDAGPALDGWLSGARARLDLDARAEHQRQTAAPRTELGANGATGLNQQPANSNTGLQTQPNGRSALFNADEIAQLAAQIRASQAAL